MTPPPTPTPTPPAKHATGIQGFDELLCGGLPRNRTTMIAGTSGSCKTLLAVECLWRTIEDEHGAVIITFEERSAAMRDNLIGMGWDLANAIDRGKLIMIDALHLVPQQETGAFDLGGLLAQLRFAVAEIDAKIVLLDAMGTLFSQFADDFMIRSEILRIADHLSELGVTTLMTMERLHEYGMISRYGVEEYVSDVVVVLRNVLEEERCRRTIQVLKLRGGDHLKGEYPFTIDSGGLQILPIVSTALSHSSSTERLASGNDRLDQIAGGGFFQDSILLVSGATGTGKTLLASTFAIAGCPEGEKTLILAYEESRPQLMRNADGWGMGFARWEEQDLLKLECVYPEAMGLEDHLVRIRRLIDTFQPKRLVIDSLSALERVGTIKVFREFVISLSALVKERNICSLLTATTPGLAGGSRSPRPTSRP